MRDYEIDKLVRLEGTNYDRRRKLSVQDVTKIRNAYYTGRLSISQLATIYNVTYLTIKYHVDSQFKKDINERRNCYAPSDADPVAQRANRIQYKKSILESRI